LPTGGITIAAARGLSAEYRKPGAKRRSARQQARRARCSI